MLHETTRNNDFLRNTAVQHCFNMVWNGYNTVSTEQHSDPLKIVVANRPV